VLAGYECQREIQGVEAESAPSVVMNERYREEYVRQADQAADQLMSALEGSIRNGDDPAASKQLRAQLSRWIKRRRSSASATPA